MRIWTLHPKYLDSKGIVALWREALLAKAVLQGKTKGYRNHPQLIRFSNSVDPAAYIEKYLEVVLAESLRRGYKFDASKIKRTPELAPLSETEGQLLYEWEHLKKKLKDRSTEKYSEIAKITTPEPHPLFKIVKGDIQSWEKTGD